MELRSIFVKIARKVLSPVSGFFYPKVIKALQVCHPEWQSRRWSNAELRRWGSLFSGNVINVSGWDDRDKEGGHYQDYFPNKASYSISNIDGARGLSGAANEIFLDLTQEVPEDLKGRFDVVFNHTTLEHIFDIHQALAGLCELTRDLVIIVVPFMQAVHYEPGSFLDYWRPTPFALEALFRENGLEVVYCANNDNPVYNVYIYCLASRFPERWRSAFPPGSGAISASAAPGLSWQEARLPGKK